MLKDIDFFIFWRLKENIPPIDLHLIFGDPDFWNIEFDELSISNLIFTACVACKNQVQTRKRIKLINLDISQTKCK